MKEVKEFILKFFKKEASAYDKWLNPDFKLFNKVLEDLHLDVTLAMNGTLGMIPLLKPEKDEFYERYKDEPPTNPRHLFKISHYESSTYGDVWVCYCSGTNPRINSPILTHAFFVIREEKEFKVARKYILSDQGGMSTEYWWEEGPGLHDLTFELLGELQGVERYLEPKDRRGALKLYHQDA